MITDTIRYVGVDDKDLDLFEGQYSVPQGMCYNSYVVFAEKIAVIDSVDAKLSKEWLEKLKSVLGDKSPDYFVIQHVEPDHSGSIAEFIRCYPQATVVASKQAFAMIKNFYGLELSQNSIAANDGDELSLGGKTLRFITAPMVHWPEVIMTFCVEEKALFSADAFGKFGIYAAQQPWEDEARRYYMGIVAKYGVQVQAALKKLQELEIEKICPLHGPVLAENISHYIELYSKWSGYIPEQKGVVIAYTSVYGNTKKAVELLRDELFKNGVESVALYDLAREDMSLAVAEAFRYSSIVLATTTYNTDIFPFMKEFIDHLTERGFKNRTVGIIENGSWAPTAARIIKSRLAECKGLDILEGTVKIMSSVSDANIAELSAMASELSK